MIKCMAMAQGLAVAWVVGYLVDATQRHPWERWYYLGLFLLSAMLVIVWGLRGLQRQQHQTAQQDAAPAPQ